jgi:hypothetical protein
MKKVAHFVLCWTTFDGDMTNPSGRVIRSDFFFLVGYFVTLKKRKRAQSYKSGATPIADLVLMGCYYYQNRLTTAITRHIPMKSRYVTATGSCIQMGQCTDLFFSIYIQRKWKVEIYFKCWRVLLWRFQSATNYLRV